MICGVALSNKGIQKADHQAYVNKKPVVEYNVPEEGVKYSYLLPDAGEVIINILSD